MCIIIITNPQHPISKEELEDAWTVNPHGGGLAYVEDNAVIFERGFMNKAYYIKRVLELQDDHELLLHMRISTGAGVTPQGTHPYKAGNVLAMRGRTQQPVAAMNGTIAGQRLETKQGAKLNDTASYIKDHAGAFKVINEDVLNIIAHDTGARWAAATPTGIIYSNDFEEYEGRHYSNLNHLWRYALLADVYDYAYSTNDYSYDYKSSGAYLRAFLDDKLLREIKKDKSLYLELREYEYQHCQYYDCKHCEGCIADCSNKHDIIRFLDNNEYIWERINNNEGEY